MDENQLNPFCTEHEISNQRRLKPSCFQTSIPTPENSPTKACSAVITARAEPQSPKLDAGLRTGGDVGRLKPATIQ